MIRHSTGEINPTFNWWGLERIKIPIPDLSTQDKILSDMKEKEIEIQRFKRQIELRNNEIKRIFRGSISLTKKIKPSGKLGAEHIAEVELMKEKQL